MPQGAAPVALSGTPTIILQNKSATRLPGKTKSSHSPQSQQLYYLQQGKIPTVYSVKHDSDGHTILVDLDPPTQGRPRGKTLTPLGPENSINKPLSASRPQVNGQIKNKCRLTLWPLFCLIPGLLAYLGKTWVWVERCR